MIDRLLHHAEVISLKGDSYRLKDRDLGSAIGVLVTLSMLAASIGAAAGRQWWSLVFTVPVDVAGALMFVRMRAAAG